MARRYHAGETWFVKLPRGELVIAVELDEVTEATIVLRRVPDLGWQKMSEPYRFKRAEVEFVEQLK